MLKDEKATGDTGVSERDRQLADGLEYLRLTIRKELVDNVAKISGELVCPRK
jgi:hypothetical protein